MVSDQVHLEYRKLIYGRSDRQLFSLCREPDFEGKCRELEHLLTTYLNNIRPHWAQLLAVPPEDACYEEVRNMVKVLNYILEADVDDEIAELYLDGHEFTIPEIKKAIRKATIANAIVPVVGVILSNMRRSHTGHFFITCISCLPTAVIFFSLSLYTIFSPPL